MAEATEISCFTTFQFYEGGWKLRDIKCAKLERFKAVIDQYK